MNFKSTIVTALFTMFAASAANATVLTFDSLTRTFGDGFALGTNMTSATRSLSYTENGFVLTLFAPHAGTATGAHIGDGTNVSGTYNWHDASDNGAGSYVTLTAADGGLFNLTGFDYSFNVNTVVSATGYANQTVIGTGTSALAFNNISSITFTTTGTRNQLDNIKVAAVPEPASLALLGAGLLGLGALRRKAAKK